MNACDSKTIPNATSHLVALESEAETIVMYVWLNSYPYNFWVDGLIKYTEATYITQNLTYWEWSQQLAKYWSYLNYANVLQSGNNAIYLHYNSSSMHEYRSARQDVLNHYICEASG